MKTIKYFTQWLSILAVVTLSITACSQNNQKITEKSTNEVIRKKMDTLEMDNDSLSARISGKVDDEILKRKADITDEALSTIAETNVLLEFIEQNKTKEAIKKGKELIGNLEVLLAKDPSLALIPVDINQHNEEFIADLSVVRDIVKSAKEAFKKGYYRKASDLLKDMRSEVIINTYLIPTATYPQAIRDAIILLEDNKKDEAKALLLHVLNTIVVEKDVLPLPVLKAEQMIIEASTIDAANHDNVDKVINLLNNADYQLTLAEEMGYGKKDKEFKEIEDSIRELKKSVNKKEDSAVKFDSLKSKIKKFQERLFFNNKKK